MSETPPRGLRAAFAPLPPEPRTTRRTLTVAGLWVVTAVPFAVDVDHQGWPAIIIGLLVTGYIAVAAWRLPMVALPVAAVTALFDWRYLFTLALAAQVAGRRTAGPRYALAVVAVAATLGTGAAFAIGQDLYDWSFRVGGLVVFGLFPWLVGLHRRQRAALVRAGWQRAAQLEEQQRIVAEQARLRERARIASDMHDFLGHHLSLAALHAGALELDTTLSERQVAKAGELRASIATAARQLREIIDVLRDAGDPVPTAPAGEGIRELVARSVAAGMDVELDVAVDLDGVDLMRRRTAYRLVQEALTNVAKHAPGAPARVAIGARPDALEISVVNGPPTRPPAGDRARGNTGLAGLRERARLLGGTFDSGPRPDGGFAVCMLLTHAPKPAPAPAPPPPSVERDFRTANTRVRRSLLVAVLAPVLAGTLLVLALMGLYAYDSFTSELSPREYESLRIGQTRADLVDVLPRRQVPERGAGPPPPEPADSRCEFYRSTAGFLPARFDVYRLCFRDDVLVGKDVLAR